MGNPFIDAGRYHVETGSGDPDATTIRVVRKADGAFYEHDITEEGPGFLWLYAAGFKDLAARAEEWIEETVKRAIGDPSTAQNELWTFPEGVLEAWAREFGYAPDTLPDFTMSDTAWALDEERRRPEREAREAEWANLQEEIMKARAEDRAEHERQRAAKRRRARRAKAFQSLIDKALAREFGKPIPVAAH
jgi:hypothetical protein